MLLHKFENIVQNKTHFYINTSQQQVLSWDDYREQYRASVYEIVEEGRRLHYQINARTRPFLFLLRHYFELTLKSILVGQGIDPSKSHVFEELYQIFNDNSLQIPVEFKNAVNILNLDDDGSCFRYFSDKQNIIYFPNVQTNKIHEILQNYNKVPRTSIFFKQICDVSEFPNPLRWEFTGHLHECQTLGQLRTQYDLTIELLIKRILAGFLKINGVYLPMLFLTRHAIELALKESIIKILEIEQNQSIKEKTIEKIVGEHSLARLFNIFKRYLDKLDLTKLAQDLKTQTEDHIKNYESLKESIHILDSNSRQFRYPNTQNMPLRRNSVSAILKTYYEADAFITFCIEVFKEHGMIPLSYEEMQELYGFTI